MSKRVRFAILSGLVVISVLLSWTSTTHSALKSLAPSSWTVKSKNARKKAHMEWLGELNNTQIEKKSSLLLQRTQSSIAEVDNVRPMTTQAQNNSGQHQRFSSSTQSITILVQLSGELGNNLGKIAHGICLQEWLEDEFRTASKIVLRHQRHAKWIHGYQNAIKCFPYSRRFDFEAGNTPSIDTWLEGQRFPDWWETMLPVNRNGADATTIREALQSTVNQWRQNLVNAANTLNNVTTMDGTPLSNPFVFANQFAHLHVCMDKYYDLIRARLAFNTSECCNQVPLANESVFVSVPTVGFDLNTNPLRVFSFPFQCVSPERFLFVDSTFAIFWVKW